MKLLSGNKIIGLDKQISNEPSLTPKLPFSIILSASKGKGKSSLLINMLINKDMLAGKFNQIHIISPTNKLDVKMNILKETSGIIKPNLELLKVFKNKMNIVSSEIPEYNNVLTESDFHEKVDIQLLENLIKQQKMVIERYGKSIADNILLVYDDCASQKKFWNSNQVQQLVFNSRHYKISIIITTQNYKSIPKPLRLNTSIFVLFYTANLDELKNIYNENNSNLTFTQFSSLFKKVCNSRDYNFLVVNYQNNEKYRYSECFEKFVN